MSTYMEVVLEVVTGDDLVIDTIKPGDTFTIMVGDDTVTAAARTVRYVPEEEIEGDDFL
jgi:hypothetical protein